MIMKTKMEHKLFFMSKVHRCSPSGNDRMIAISEKNNRTYRKSYKFFSQKLQFSTFKYVFYWLANDGLKG